MFYLNYDKKTGQVVSYTEAPDESYNDVTNSSTTGTLTFKAPPAMIWNGNGSITVKVNVDTLKLELLNPVQIPEPLPNPPNAALSGADIAK